MVLSQKQLENVFKSNKNYKYVDDFLDAIAQGQTQCIDVINNVCTRILDSEKVDLLQKLLVLRFYKDIFMLGNMEAFQMIDEEIHNAVISAAAFNPADGTKNQSRGALYFYETQGRAKNEKNFQLSHSFVILATEIVQHFAEWYPVSYRNKDISSRFASSFQKLKELGVRFETNVYFKEGEREEFEQAYEEWFQEYRKLHPEPQSSKDSNPNIMIEKGNSCHNCAYNADKLLELEQKLRQQTQALQKEKQKVEDQREMWLRNSQGFQQDRQNWAKEKEELLKNTGDTQAILEQLSRFKGEVEIKQKEVQEFRRRCTELEGILQQKQRQHNISVQNLHQTLKLLQSKVATLQNQKALLQKQNKILIESQNQQPSLDKFVSENRKKENELEDQLKKVRLLLQNDKNIYTQQINNLKIQNSQLKQKNIQLQQKLQQIRGQCEQLKKKDEQKQQTILKLKDELQNFSKMEMLSKVKKVDNDFSIENVNNFIPPNNSSFDPKQQSISYKDLYNRALVLEEEEKNRKSLERNNESQVKPRRSLRKSKQQSMSMSRLLANTPKFSEPQPTHFHDQEKVVTRSASNSLSKTQMSKYRNNRMYETDKMSRWAKQGTFSNNLYKTQSNWKKNDAFSKGWKTQSTVVYQFLEEYFQPIIISESAHFRACVLVEKARHKPIFSDNIIDIYYLGARSENNWNKSFEVLIKNKTSNEIKIKISCSTPQISIKGGQQFNLYGNSQKIVFLYEGFFNINFRFPTLILFAQFEGTDQFMLGNSKNQRKYKIPLPLTLLSISNFSQNQKQIADLIRLQQIDGSIQKKIKSQRVAINSVVETLPNAFPSLRFEYSPTNRLEARALVTLPQIEEIKVLMRLTQLSHCCEVEMQFAKESKMSQAFAKVLLQATMFSLIEKKH